MNYLALIPARYASTRFPGKPLVDILGKPMIQHVYERACQVFTHCYVATDDQRIADAVASFGGNVVMTSPHHRSGTDRCLEAYQIISRSHGIDYDVVVNIQGDEPYIQIQQLTQIRECFEDEQTQIATLVKPFGEGEDIFNENLPKVVLSSDNYALYFSRSPIPFMRGVERSQWQASHQYLKHIGLYAYRSKVLCEIGTLNQGDLELCESLEQLRWLENGYRIKVAKTDFESHAIDTPADLEHLLTMIKNQ